MEQKDKSEFQKWCTALIYSLTILSIVCGGVSLLLLSICLFGIALVTFPIFTAVIMLIAVVIGITIKTKMEME